MFNILEHIYKGEFKNNKNHGKGTITYADGDMYNGKWQNNKRHGTLTTGKWVNDENKSESIIFVLSESK